MISIAIFILIAWQIIWLYTEWQNNKANIKTTAISLPSWIKRAISLSAGVFGYLQLTGVIKLFTFPASTFLVWLGFLMLIVGFLVSVIARLTLGRNWVHAAEYQIVKNHKLIDTGIYTPSNIYRICLGMGRNSADGF